MTLKVFQEILTDLGTHWSPLVAGGAVRDHFLGIRHKDIDIFVPSKDTEDFSSIIESLPEAFAGELLGYNGIHDLGLYRSRYGDAKEYENSTEYPVAMLDDLVAVWEGVWKGHKVNIIGRVCLEDNLKPEPLLNGFDFGILRAAVLPDGQVIKTPEFCDGLRKREMRLMHDHTYAQSLRRFNRFQERVGLGVLQLIGLQGEKMAVWRHL